MGAGRRGRKKTYMDATARRNATICTMQALWYYWMSDMSRAEHCILQALTWTYPVAQIMSHAYN